MSPTITFKNSDGALIHPAKIYPNFFVTFGKDFKSPVVTMLLNVNDVRAIIDEIRRLDKLPVMQIWTGIKTEKTQISSDEEDRYNAHMAEYKAETDTDAKEKLKAELQKMPKPTKKTRIRRAVNLEDSIDIQAAIQEFKPYKSVTKGKPFIDTHTQTFLKFTDSKKTKSTVASTTKNFTIRIEVDDRRTSIGKTPTFEQKNNADMVVGEVKKHYNVKVIQSGGGKKGLMVPQYVDPYQMLGFASHLESIVDVISTDLVRLNTEVTIEYFKKKKQEEMANQKNNKTTNQGD